MTKRTASAAAVVFALVISASVGVTTAGAASKPTGTPIVIGQVETQTGVQGQSGRVTTAEDALTAWAKWTNAHGGVAGHPVEVKTIDDKADPAASLAALKQLVEEDDVVAIVGQAAQPEPTWKDYIAEVGVPVIGGNAYSANWFTQPMFYPATTTVISVIYGFIEAGAVADKDKLASILCSNLTVCQQSRALIVNAAENLGMEVVYEGTADANQPNYTPQCLAMKEAGADVISPQGINQVTVLRDCDRQDYHPLLLGTEYPFALEQIGDISTLLKGIRGDASAMSPYNQYPATKDYFAAMKKYAPNLAPGGSTYEKDAVLVAMKAWVAGEVFKKAVENAGVAADAAVTTPDVIKGLSMFENETLGGLAPGFTYSDGTEPNPQVKCYYMFTVTKTGYKDDLENKVPKVYCEP